MLKFNVITLFPELFQPHLSNLPFRKAVENGLIEVNLIQLRNFAIDKRGTVDDKPYGGGIGMILRIEPIYNAVKKIYGGRDLSEIQSLDGNTLIALSPRGERYNQKAARRLSGMSEVTLICGRYEGMDARVEENIATEVISIGDFVLSGGEIPALTVMESAVRLLPGVLEKEGATDIESFSKVGKSKSGDMPGAAERSDVALEFPQYTRPEEFEDMRVPEVLLSGHHKEIEKWREENSRKVIL